MKELSKNQQTVIRNIASGVYATMDKIESLQEKIQNLQEAIRVHQMLIDKDEQYVSDVTGGFKSTDLFKRIQRPTERKDKDGNVVYVTALEFTMPEETVENSDYGTEVGNKVTEY